MSDSTKPPRKRKIFINYRRADNTDFVERIRDWFVLRYGRESVFMDFDNIPPFTKFADFIRETVADCDVLVAIIGPAWMQMLQEKISQHDEEDYVQVEIKLALEQKKLIAPICIKGAPVPKTLHLPPDLRPLMDYNVAHLNSGREFLDNIGRIIDALEKKLDELEGMKVVSRDIDAIEQISFNIRHVIKNFETAETQGDYQAALHWLHQIRTSGYAPAYYPLDDYETEIKGKILIQQTESAYQFIRSMADRAIRKPSERDRVWTALKSFWQTYPGYDPDDLASQFRLMPDYNEELEDYETLVLTPNHVEFSAQIHGTSSTPDNTHLTISPIDGFDVSLLDRLDSLDESTADDIFTPEHMAVVAADLDIDPRTITLTEAEQSGILNWQS